MHLISVRGTTKYDGEDMFIVTDNKCGKTTYI